MEIEYVGSIHLHTSSSDGAATHEEVAHLASRARLDFLVATDHNVLAKDKDGWYGDLLLLVGEELHDTQRSPEANHYLAFNIEEHVDADNRSAQEVIDEVNAQGGFGFIAHPFEHSPAFTREPELPWVDWEVTGYTGLEIWNYMSEFKSYLHNLLRVLFFVYFPQVIMSGPFPETIAKWDELLKSRKTAAIAGTDVHGNTYALGPLRRAILPYGHCFRAARTHILASEPFTRNLEHDRALVYEALKHGRCFAAYDAIADSSGFRFTASSGGQRVGMGQEISLNGGRLDFQISSPMPAELRLLRDGQVIARAEGRQLHYTARESGAYRVEARRRYLFSQRGWVFTNPIYATA
jgi:hypothetical protein